VTKCFLKIGQEFGKEFASLEYPMGITIPEKIRRVEGKTAFVESGRSVSMTLARCGYVYSLRFGQSTQIFSV